MQGISWLGKDLLAAQGPWSMLLVIRWYWCKAFREKKHFTIIKLQFTNQVTFGFNLQSCSSGINYQQHNQNRWQNTPTTPHGRGMVSPTEWIETFKVHTVRGRQQYCAKWQHTLLAHCTSRIACNVPYWHHLITWHWVAPWYHATVQPEAWRALPLASVHVHLKTSATRHSVLTHRCVRQQTNFTEFRPHVTHTSATRLRVRWW